MACAKKSSRWAGNARRPICWSRWGRLFVGVFVVSSEFIVSLQVMRLDVNELRLRVATEVDGGKLRRGFLLSLPQQKGNRRGAWGIPFQCLTDGTAQSRRAIEV